MYLLFALVLFWMGSCQLNIVLILEFLQERRFKELFYTIPSLDDLYALETEGLRPNVILVNLHKDKKLSMLKQLTLTLVKGLSSTPAVVVKKIAGLVRHLLFCCLYWGLVLTGC